MGIFDLGWNVFKDRRDRAFDVRVTVEPVGVGVEVGSGKYEVEVVARNHGATHEAVQEVQVYYAEHEAEGVEVPSVRVPLSEPRELLPKRNVRERVDLVSRFGPFPTEFTAVVLLESGRRPRSKPFRTSPASLQMAMAGRESAGRGGGVGP